MRITVSIAEHENGERGFNYRMWVHLMAPDLSKPLSPGGKHPSRWNRAGEALTRLLFQAQSLDEPLQAFHGWPTSFRLVQSFWNYFNIIWFAWTGTKTPRVSVVDQVLWKADSWAEMCVHWEDSWDEHLWWYEDNRVGRGSWSAMQMWQRSANPTGGPGAGMVPSSCSV